MSSAASGKRPGWVVVISIVYFVFGVATLVSSYFIQSGSITAPPEYQKYLESLTTSDHTFNVLIAAANTLGAVALFLMRKAAFPFFLSSLCFNVLMTLWRMVSKGWAHAFVGGSVIGFLLGCLILLMICMYTNKLSKSGVLR